MRVRVLLGVTLALVGAALVTTLSQRGERMAGTSFVLQRAFTVFLPPSGETCQASTWLADDSAAAQLTVGTYGRPRPRLTVSFRDPDGSLVARGAVVAGGPEGSVVVPFAHVVEGNHPSTTACVRSAGAYRVALAGDLAGPDGVARVNGRAAEGAVGFRYLRDGRESWWVLAPVVAQRFGLGKASVFGTWTLPVLALVLVALWVAGIRLVLRETRSAEPGAGA